MDRRRFLRSVAVEWSGSRRLAQRRIRRSRRRGDHQALRRAALGARQHHPRQRDRLGPAALDLSVRPVRRRSQCRFRGDPRPRAEDGRYRAGVREHRQAPRGQGARGRSRRQSRDRARQLVHGRHPLRRGRVAVRRFRSAAHRACTGRSASAMPITRGWPTTRSRRCRSRSKANRSPAWFHLPPRLHRRQAAGGDRHSRDGQLQGDQRRAGQRPLDVARASRC